MAITLNGFEQGTSGNAITAAGSGGGADVAFDSVTTNGAGSAATYDNAHAKRGTLSGKFVVAGAASSTSYVTWAATVGTQTTVYLRAYIWSSANPSGISPIIRVMNGANLAASVSVTTTGLLQIRDANNAVVTTTTNALTAGQWGRVEFKVVCSATVGTAEVRLYNSADSTTATETVSGTGLNTNTQATTYRLGACTAGGAITMTVWLDDIGVSTTDWLGPSTVAATSTASLSLAASGTVTAPAGAAAAMDLSAAGAVQAPVTASAAQVTLSAAATAQSPATGAASVALNATGTVRAAATGTSSLNLTGQATPAAPANGTASVDLLAALTAQAQTAALATLELLAQGSAVTFIFTPTPAERVYRIDAESRVLPVAAEWRTVRIPAESRRIVVS